MGKKSKTQTPAPMDTTALGQQQADENERVYDVNLNAARPNQSNVFGNLTWSQDPDTGQWTQNVGLSQEQQGLMGGLTGLTNTALGGYDASNIDFSQLGDMPQVGQYNQQATDLYNKLAQPQLDRQRSAKEAQMAAMGLNLGSGRAYDTQQELLNDSANRSAMMGAQAGIQQGNTMFGQALQSRQQGANEMLSQKEANLGQLSGLMGLRQNIGSPQFQSVGATPQLSGVDYTGLANQKYQQQLNATNASNADRAAKNQSTASTLGTVASVAAIAF